MFKKIYINISKQPLVYKISFILIISFILRFLFAIIMYHYGGGENTFIDDWDYIAIAKNILSQGIMLRDLSLLPSNSYVVGIGYPLIVSFFIKFFQDNYFPLIIINVIISTSTVYIIFLLGKEVFSEKIGLYSASWSTFYILFYQYLPRVHKAVAVQMLVPLTLLLIIKESKNNSISLKSIFPILIYSYLIHTDERYLFIFPILALTLLINNNHSYKIRFKKVSVFVAGVMITMLPWLIRNYIVFDRVVVLTDRTSGFTNKFFSYSDSIGYFAEYDIEHNVNRDLKWEPYMLDEIKDGNDIYGMSPKRLRSIRQGIKYNIVPRQYTYIEGKYYEFKELWIPFRIKPEFRQTGFKFEKPWSLKHNLSQGLTYGLLLPLFIIGIAGIIKYRNKYGIIMLCIIASNTIIHVFLAWARQRYRIPIDSFIIITAFYGLKYSYDFILIKAKGKIK